jgi:quercetin dioxygenase-like cupin family protein
MKAHDIANILRGTPVLNITAETTEEEASAAFPMLAPFNQGGVFVGRFSGLTPWERHPEADELVHVLEGEVEITFLTNSGRQEVVARTGTVVIVPRGVWHRQLPRPAATLLTATPKPTEVSFADDPRIPPAKS